MPTSSSSEAAEASELAQIQSARVGRIMDPYGNEAALKTMADAAFGVAMDLMPRITAPR